MNRGKLLEGFRFLNSMDWRRGKNLFDSFRSYHSKQARITGINRAYPISLSVEPTTSCNLRCPECPSGLRSFSRETGMLQTDLFQSVLDQLSSHLIYLNLYFQGEPLLHPSFFDLVKMARKKGIFTNTSSNAHYFTEEKAEFLVDSGLDRLIVSIDGTTQEVYESYRVGGELEKVLDGTRFLVEAKKKMKSKSPLIFFQFLVNRQNEGQIGEARNLTRSIGVDGILFKSMQILDLSKPSPFLPRNSKYSRYKSNSDGSMSLRGKFEDECWRMWSGAVITWDGKVVPCCFDKDAEHRMGDLSENSFDEVWNGEGYRTFRKQIFSNRSKIEMCKNCSEGARIWLAPT
jgi:radical SAM protein with 4Fe4S-binding SPASM domain